MADKPRHLLSGYAAGILDQDERSELMEAALVDQDVFDRLVEEESWRRIFNAPGMRRELLEALEQPSLMDRMFGWLRPPQVQVALGTATMAVMMAFLVPSWMDSRSGVELTPKSIDPKTATSETAAPETRSLTSDQPELVAKSFHSKAEPTATTRPPVGGDLRSMSFGLELLQPQEVRPVAEGYRFKADDQFRVHLKTDFPAWVYLFNRAEGDDVYSVIYPQAEYEQAAQQGVLLVPASDALVMDETPDDEELILVVSTAPWALLKEHSGTIARQQLDEALLKAESELESASWRRFVEGEQVHLKIADLRGELLFVERLLP